jgi:hypothetical protein
VSHFDWQVQQIREAGHTPVICGGCTYPGYVDESTKTGFLVRHPGRGVPCRTPVAEVIWDGEEVR